MTIPNATILIVEDEAKMRRLLELNLGDDGFQTLSAEDAETGLRLLQNGPVDLVITDLKLPGMNGLDFLQAVKRFQAALPVIVMTAFGTVETAVEAMKAGASDYVLKPFSLDEMRMGVVAGAGLRISGIPPGVGACVCLLLWFWRRSGRRIRIRFSRMAADRALRHVLSLVWPLPLAL